MKYFVMLSLILTLSLNVDILAQSVYASQTFRYWSILLGSGFKEICPHNFSVGFSDPVLSI